MKIGLRIVGRRALQRWTARTAKRIPSEIERNLHRAAQLIEASAKKNIHGSRTRARRKHRPVTAPPHVLGVDTGRLRQSISYDVYRRGRRWNAEIGPQRVPYARIHEFGGTVGRARIPKRPYLGPAIDKNRERVFRLIGRTFEVV